MNDRSRPPADPIGGGRLFSGFSMTIIFLHCSHQRAVQSLILAE
jgi:hypothetical protein